MHRYRNSIFIILTLTAVFFDTSLAAIDLPNNAASAHPLRSGDNQSSILSTATQEPSHALGNHDSNDYDSLENDGDPEDKFDLRDAVNSGKLSNSASAVAGQKKRSLSVKDVTCSGRAAGRNITAAWHWAGVGGYGEYAILWMCNCSWKKSIPVNCWELNEAIRLLERKCGSGQGGRVRLHGKREIGRTSLRHIFSSSPFSPFPSLMSSPLIVS
ncbi:hypothetical protein NUW58_g8552 [Xylaria curta]|uniref:Uncharacterized protein n=1 Tax=Xylaria curta TaxID=42375 RepID=A0ACC1N6P7_9PEZI|nr:hypothetical protein NUW58_g8552 [Xylaria curta]